MAILTWVKSKIGAPQPAGPETLLRRFTPSLDVPIAADGVSEIEDGWRLETEEDRTFPLFEVADPDIEQCMVAYRAELRSEGVRKRAYLEMWCPNAFRARDVVSLSGPGRVLLEGTSQCPEG